MEDRKLKTKAATTDRARACQGAASNRRDRVSAPAGTARLGGLGGGLGGLFGRTGRGWARITGAVALAGALLCQPHLVTSVSAAPPLKNLPIQVSSIAHPGTSVRWGRAEGVVEAPVDAVRKIVGNYGAYHEFLPSFRTSRVLSQRGSRALVYMEAGIAKNTLTIWAQMKISPMPSVGKTEVIEAHMLKGNLEFMEAQWELTPLDAGRTRVAFQILVDPKVPLPASLVTRENEKASKRTIGALRKRVKAG